MNWKNLSVVGGLAATIMAILTLQTEIGTRLDSLIVSEAEAADFADQHKIDRLRARMDVLRLQYKHAESENELAAITAELKLTARQLAHVLCVSDPRGDPDKCLP